MVDDATIRIGSDVAGAIADILAVGAALQTLEAEAVSASAVIASATGAIAIGFAGVGIAAGAAAVGGVAMAIDAFEEYEQAIANAASVTGAFGDDYIAVKANIESVAQTLGETTVFSAQQAADALYDLASAGYDVGKITAEDLRPILDLAAATQSDLTQTTQIVTATLAQFGLGISDSKQVADVFVGAITTSKETLEKMGLSFRYVGTIAAQFGETVDDTSAALALMANSGLRGEQIGRSLRIAYQRLANPTADVVEVLSKLGLTVDDVNQENMTLNDTLMLLASRGITVGETMKFFGVESATGMGSLVSNTPLLQEFADNLDNVGGLAHDVATQQLDTLNGNLTLLFSKINILAIEIGRKFAPYVRDAADVFGEISKILLNNVDPAFAQLQQYVQDLEPTWIALKSSVLSVIGITQDLAGDNAVGWLIDQINTLSTAMALVFQFFDQHPTILQTAKTVAVASVMFLALEGAVALASAAYAGYLAMIGFVNTAMLVYNGVMVGAITWTGVLESLLALLGGPITLIIIAISLLAAAWYTNFGGIRDFTGKIVDDIIDMFWDSIDALEHYINTAIVMYNDLMDKLGMSDKKAGLWAVESDMRDMFKSGGDAIEKYITEPINDVFSIDTGGFEVFDLTNMEAAAAVVDGMVQDAMAIEQSQIAGTEAANEMIQAYKSFGESGSDSRLWGAKNTGALQFSSEADVKAARESGELTPGTVFEVNVNVKRDGEDADSGVDVDVVQSVGGV